VIDSTALVYVSLTLLGVLVLIVGPIRAIYQIYINVKESRPPYVEIQWSHAERVSREYPIFRVLKDLTRALFVVGIATLALAIALPRLLLRASGVSVTRDRRCQVARPGPRASCPPFLRLSCFKSGLEARGPGSG
jgi:hypothetical protein